MITRMFPLQFLKKSPFFGSHNGKMRYRLMKEEDQLSLCIYPEPFSIDATPEEQKKYFHYEFSDDGYEEAIACLNQVYEETDWDKVPFSF